jgi:molybdopterin-guanine dinucleotide biosynthesis protein B
MKLFGLAGWSGSGKTTLLIALLVLIRRGLRVATLKHVHHSIDLDQPGKDTHRHRLAGGDRNGAPVGEPMDADA